MSSTLAAVFEGVPGSIELRRLPTPVPIGAEILARVLGCTLCGSDLHTFEGRRAVPVPTVLGHEIVGEIAAKGEDAPGRDAAGRELRVGDRIAWAIVANCGVCFPCRHDLPQKCVSAVKYGHESFRPRLELTGGLAEHCLLAPGTSVVRLPDELPLEVACPASCATATVAAAIEASGTIEGAAIAVLGAGMLGLTACAAASFMGAREVICVEPTERRRTAASNFGAGRTVEPDDTARAASEATDGRGFDVVLELSGSPAAFRNAWPSVRTGGTVVLVGSVFPSEPVPLALEDVVRRCLTIRGIHNYAPRHLARGIEFLAATHRRYPFADLVTEWFPLSEVAKAFEVGSRSGSPRVGVRPD